MSVWKNWRKAPSARPVERKETFGCRFRRLRSAHFSLGDRRGGDLMGTARCPWIALAGSRASALGVLRRRFLP